ncbi:hypothetical protein EVAR_77014_1 [Eumeta japonica]|uniref:Uncharacterized protein n=1 Tax=Eumeta variegata TaxID=151549 RepID=A0A4C1SFM7_EUMVA|nr:hypothetical protein EVAR_77014_1 [Eumeta japonica]
MFYICQSSRINTKFLGRGFVVEEQIRGSAVGCVLHVTACRPQDALEWAHLQSSYFQNTHVNGFPAVQLRAASAPTRSLVDETLCAWTFEITLL